LSIKLGIIGSCIVIVNIVIYSGEKVKVISIINSSRSIRRPCIECSWKFKEPCHTFIC